MVKRTCRSWRRVRGIWCPTWMWFAGLGRWSGSRSCRRTFLWFATKSRTVSRKWFMECTRFCWGWSSRSCCWTGTIGADHWWRFFCFSKRKHSKFFPSRSCTLQHWLLLSSVEKWSILEGMPNKNSIQLFRCCPCHWRFLFSWSGPCWLVSLSLTGQSSMSGYRKILSYLSHKIRCWATGKIALTRTGCVFQKCMFEGSLCQSIGTLCTGCSFSMCQTWNRFLQENWLQGLSIPVWRMWSRPGPGPCRGIRRRVAGAGMILSRYSWCRLWTLFRCLSTRRVSVWRVHSSKP